MKLNYLPLLITVITITLAIAYIISPYWTIWKIQQAIASSDYYELSTLINFQTLRDDLKRIALDKVNERKDGDSSKEEFANLGKLMGIALVNTSIDAILTPSGLVKLWNRESLNEASIDSKESPRYLGTELDVQYKDVNRVVLRVKRSDKHFSGIQFILRREEPFKWKLAGLDLDIFADIRESDTAAKNPTQEVTTDSSQATPYFTTNNTIDNTTITVTETTKRQEEFKSSDKPLLPADVEYNNNNNNNNSDAAKDKPKPSPTLPETPRSKIARKYETLNLINSAKLEKLTNDLKVKDDCISQLSHQLINSQKIISYQSEALRLANNEKPHHPFQQSANEDPIVKLPTMSAPNIRWRNFPNFRPNHYQHDLAKRLNFPNSHHFEGWAKISFSIQHDGSLSNLTIDDSAGETNRRQLTAYLESAAPFRPLTDSGLSALHVRTRLSTGSNNAVVVSEIDLSPESPESPE